ncbi:MAG: penicillin acylase family protein, partial [Pseudomonadota bacterium]
MAQVFKWLVRIAGSMILLGTVAFVLLYVLLSRSLPEYDKTLRVPSLIAPVEVVRDNANVPHIFGAHDSDVFFALGYAHAQDRFWQMIMLRRTAQGRLSEVFGPRTVEIDMLMRRLDIYGLAQSSVAAQSPQAQRALAAYASGVNARIEEINASALGRGAPEMFL